jgi:hypothetical protein
VTQLDTVLIDVSLISKPTGYYGQNFEKFEDITGSVSLFWKYADESSIQWHTWPADG